MKFVNFVKDTNEEIAVQTQCYFKNYNSARKTFQEITCKLFDFLRWGFRLYISASSSELFLSL